MTAIAKYLRENRKLHLAELEEFLRIPSISTDAKRKADVGRAAKWIAQRLKRAGCKKAQVLKTPGHPIVYAEWKGAPGSPTILVYGHYDVQPVDPLEKWKSPPFEPVVRDGRIHARGASDDKGQLILHVYALEAHLKCSGSCPVNMKFLLEGEEEIGSPNLEPFIRKNRNLLACDAVVVSDTAMFAKGVPSICYGLRGLSYLEIHLKGTDGDLHSGSFGGSVVNPANALVEMLAALKDAKGRVTVPGFYDNVRRITVTERRAFASLPHSDRKFKTMIGAPELSGEANYTTLERIWARPSLDINGIWSGFTGEGAKTIIPAEAHAKISMRLVPDQTPKEISYKVSSYLKRLAPKSVKIGVRSLHGGDAWVAPTDHAALQAAGRAMKRAFGKQPVFVREGGSIPIIAAFDRMLKVPSVLMGVGLNEDNIHAPNEKLDLDHFYKGIEASAYLMEELGVTGKSSRSKTRKKPPKRKTGKS
jgi:acetylornithine deacetylase/succinyl-diaminopimelate desuccinylase-like protein